MNEKAHNPGPYLLLVIGIVAISTAAILIRAALAEASALVIAAYRLTFSTVIALLLWRLSSRPQKFNLNPQNVSLLLLSGFFLALHFAAWTISLQSISVSSSVILVTTTPLWVALLSPIFLKEKVSRQFYYGLGIAMLGGVVVGLNNPCTFLARQVICENLSTSLHSTAWSGYFLALFGAWMAAGYLLVGRKLSTEMSTLPYTAIVYGIAALFLNLAVIFQHDSFFGYTPGTFALFLALAIIPQTLGHSILNHSLHDLPASVVSLSLQGEPIGSTILAILFLKEYPSAFEIAGGILILVGIIVSVWRGGSANAVSLKQQDPD